MEAAWTVGMCACRPCDRAGAAHHLLDGIGRRRPRRGRGVFGRTRASSGGVVAALPAARRYAVLPILDLLVWCLFKWGKKKKKLKNPRTPTSVFISVIRYASRTNFVRRTGRYHGDHELPSPVPRKLVAQNISTQLVSLFTT